MLPTLVSTMNFESIVYSLGKHSDWSKYPGAVPDTYKGEILWTDGNPSYTFSKGPPSLI